jgi:hypothetical protein
MASGFSAVADLGMDGDRVRAKQRAIMGHSARLATPSRAGAVFDPAARNP